MTTVVKIILLISMIILLLMLIPIKFILIKNNNEKNILKIIICKIFKINIDLKKVSEKSINIDKIKSDFNKFKKNKKIIKSLMQLLLISKAKLEVKISNPLLGVGIYNVIIYLRSFLKENFLGVEDENYNVVLDNSFEKTNKTIDFKYEFIIYFRAGYIFLALINNIMEKVDEKIKVYIRNGGVVRGRASNKRFVSNING